MSLVGAGTGGIVRTDRGAGSCTSRGTPGGAGAARLAALGGVLSAAALLGLAAVAGVLGTVFTAERSGVVGDIGAGPSGLARRDIPLTYLRFYQRAGRRYGLDWSILAGIGRVECDHGRDPDLSCSREGAVNPAGAGGPMQFLASTWAAYGVDGDGDGRIDRWDAADAIASAAKYLRASGAPDDYRRALFAYNHAGWYVAAVESWAERYRGGGEAERSTIVPGDGVSGLQSQTRTAVRLTAGSQARLMPGEGHVALVPALAPAMVRGLVVAGNELQALAYGPGGHPDPRGSVEEDCSSTVSYVLYRAGIRPIGEILRDNPLAQDYVHWGAPGPGRWVTIYATDSPTPHTFMTIAGLRLDTSHHGTDLGPNRDQDGPRWRLLDHIPTWALWSVRHPPGL